MPVTVPDACHYTIEGQPDGPTLVFVHGWPDDASVWRHQLTALGDAYRCVMITLPNFGAGHELRGGCDILQRYRPSCPVLYLWGAAKPFHFHSDHWLDRVKASGGRYKGIEGAWHWLQLSHADEVNAEIRAFLPEPQAEFRP